MIIIDENKIHEKITQLKPMSVALNGPDGILPQVQQASMNIMKKFNIPAYVLADTTWGSCDLNTKGAETLSADILFNIGHTISMESFGNSTFMINAYDDISFDTVAVKCAKQLPNLTVSLITDSQHLTEVDKVKNILEQYGLTVLIGKGKGQLNDGQIFGCEFYPAMANKSKCDANVFLGQSNFHAAGLALSTGIPTYVLDPYFNEVREVTEFAQKLKKKATLAIYKAASCNTFGVILGLRDGQLSKTTALKFKIELEKAGKTAYLFALTDITNDKLNNLSGIEAFIQVACPRISIDNQFNKPVLSTPQGNAMLKVLNNEDIGEYLQIPHWL